MQALTGKTAVVTGASSGIGRAIALSLARHGAAPCVVGRSAASLDLVANEARATAAGARASIFEADLCDDDAMRALTKYVADNMGGADILIHSAAMHATGPLEGASIGQLDTMYRINLRAPYLLTQLLLPQLKSARGQIVFINSSQGLAATGRVGQYAATKHALKAVADSLRDEVNESGVRVLSVFLGRTATPTMERLYRSEQRQYNASLLLQPEDVAAAVLGALTLPRTAELTNLNLRPLAKSYF